MEQYLECKEKIRKRIVETCIYIPENERMFGKLPGTRYDSQFYLNNALFDPDFLENVGYCFDAIMQKNKINYLEFQLAGTESAIQLLAFLPYYIRKKHNIWINSVLIRKEPKSYGKHNLIEGMIDPHLSALIVDPLSNSTNAFYHCTKALLANDIKVFNVCFSILNKYRIKESTDQYDRYSGQYSLSILTRDDVI